jgi:hypothetical protein
MGAVKGGDHDMKAGLIYPSAQRLHEIAGVAVGFVLGVILAEFVAAAVNFAAPSVSEPPWSLSDVCCSGRLGLPLTLFH